MAAQFKLVSANLGTSLLSVSDILKTDKPDLLFLQEITNPTSELLAKVTDLGYSAECNVDSLHPTRPGTAIVWKETIKINEVNCFIERRAQIIKVGGESFVNVYAPSGSSNRREREEFFSELYLHLHNIGGGKLPVLAGDFNSVITEVDTTRHFSSKLSKVFRQLVDQSQYQRYIFFKMYHFFSQARDR